jgi:ribosomal protein S18 acetylase RimI-like enzyme
VITLRGLEAAGADLTALQALLVLCADFVKATTGHGPREDEAMRLFTEGPPGKDLADKHVLGVLRDGALVGVVELMARYPGPTDWYMGLMLFSPEARGAGIGAEALEHVVKFVAGAGGRALHLVVRENNPRAVAFWESHGFAMVERRVQKLELQENLLLKMVRPL